MCMRVVCPDGKGAWGIMDAPGCFRSHYQHLSTRFRPTDCMSYQSCAATWVHKNTGLRLRMTMGYRVASLGCSSSFGNAISSVVP